MQLKSDEQQTVSSSSTSEPAVQTVTMPTTVSTTAVDPRLAAPPRAPTAAATATATQADSNHPSKRFRQTARKSTGGWKPVRMQLARRTGPPATGWSRITCAMIAFHNTYYSI